MKLRIGDGTPHVRISTQGRFTRLSFPHQVSLHLLSIDPLRDTCYLGGHDEENRAPLPKDGVNFFTIPGDLHEIKLEACDLAVELRGIKRPLVGFTVDSHGLRNAVVFKDNEFGSLTLLDTAGLTRFDLSQQSPLVLHTETRQSSSLIFARTAGPTCVVCFDQEATEVYLPCGHWGVCKVCAVRNECGSCPICREHGGQRMSVYVA
jgi:hypothetical protein